MNFFDISQELVKFPEKVIFSTFGGFELKLIKIMANLYPTEPNIDRGLPLTMLYLPTKFEVHPLGRCRVITRKAGFRTQSHQNKWPTCIRLSQISNLTFLSPGPIHTPNLKSIGRGVLVLSSGNETAGFELKLVKIMANFYPTEPNIELDLPFPRTHPHTKFEVNRSRRSRVIVRKRNGGRNNNNNYN